MCPEIIGAEPLEKFTQRTRACGKFGAAFAVAEKARAVAVGDVYGPDVFNFVEPGAFFDVKADGF